MTTSSHQQWRDNSSPPSRGSHPERDRAEVFGKTEYDKLRRRCAVILDWYIAVTETGRKSHLTETDAYIFCAPFWGQVTKSAEYEGQTSYKGRPLCLRCEKMAMSIAAKAIARQRGDESSALWVQYQLANGHLRLNGRGQKPALDPEPKAKKRLPGNVHPFPVSASA